MKEMLLKQSFGNKRECFALFTRSYFCKIVQCAYDTDLSFPIVRVAQQ